MAGPADEKAAQALAVRPFRQHIVSEIPLDVHNQCLAAYMNPMDESTRWRIRLPVDRAGDLKEEGLRHLVLLGRMLNSIRVLQFTYLGAAETDTPAGSRQRIGAFLLLASILHEGLTLLRQVGKTFHSLESWNKQMVPILRSDLFRQFLRDSVRPLRNQAVFHFDEGAIAEPLARCDLPVIVLIEGTGKQSGDVHYPLSDLMAVNLFTGPPADAEEQEERFRALVTQTGDLMAAVANAGESVVTEYCVAMRFAREVRDAQGLWRAL